MSLHAEPPPPIVREPKGIQYATSDQLGKGGFAICYRAMQCEGTRPTGKIVALKIVKSKMEPPKLAQKFVTELQLHSKLGHPNIVEFYRAFSFEKNTYVVLEICDNGSLADALKKRKFFTMPEIRRLIIQTCGAVKYLHHRNIVHRDLKTGNLFLDAGMNIKVGDFGLAAVLVGKNDLGLRRTTMCGTPNYLAPEILEKGGKGHNEKVDLWAIGIIAYTLAVGKAPFHAAKREEIYKKLQIREYEWPDLSKHQNDISNDLRDLVSSLLVDEDDRPNPDKIVSHSFFKLSFIPDHLDSTCTSVKPIWQATRPPTAETIRRGFSESWMRLCKASGVGEYAPGRTFPVVGAGTMASVVKDVEKEIKANRAPTVPIADGTVYLPFVSERKDKSNRVPNNLSEIAEERESSSSTTQLAEISANDRTKRSSKALDGKGQPPAKLKENLEPQVPAAVANLGRGTLRRTRSNRAQVEEVKRVPSQTLQTITTVPAASTITKVDSEPLESLKQSSKQSLPEEKPRRVASIRAERPTRTKGTSRSRQASREEKAGGGGGGGGGEEVVPKATTNLILERPIRSRSMKVTQPPEKTAKQERKASQPEASRVVKPAESQPVPVDSQAQSHMPWTDPTTVLHRATQLRDGLLSALSNKERNAKIKGRNPELPFVSKWVDYAKKHGIGYVLGDGTIGCIFNATSRHPVTHVAVRNGYSYLDKSNGDTIAIGQIPLEYYSEGSKEGIQRIEIEGERRKVTGVLWAKFGKYMCQQLGTSGEKKNAAKADAEEGGSNGEGQSTMIVRYYERLGTVGIWGFSDGCFQFNFPDHTKLVVSADGRCCSFTCLPTDAMAYIQKHGDLPFKCIKHREVLSGPVLSLLNGNPEVTDMTAGNLLRLKLKFVADVVDQWIQGGGLGCRPADSSRVRWTGPRLEDAGGKKVDYITVGRFGGDSADAT